VVVDVSVSSPSLSSSILAFLVGIAAVFFFNEDLRFEPDAAEAEEDFFLILGDGSASLEPEVAEADEDFFLILGDGGASLEPDVAETNEDFFFILLDGSGSLEPEAAEGLSILTLDLGDDDDGVVSSLLDGPDIRTKVFLATAIVSGFVSWWNRRKCCDIRVTTFSQPL